MQFEKEIRGQEERLNESRIQKVAGFFWGGGGHMVNDQLGGTGDVSNNVPIPSSRNGKRKTIENRVTMILPTVVKLRYEINEYQQARNQGEWLNDGEEFSRRVQASI